MGLISFFTERKTLVIVLLLLGIALLVCGYTSSRAELSHFKAQVSKLEFSEQVFEETINESGKIIVEQEQLILSQKDAISLKILEIDRLKKVKSQVIVSTITQIDSVFIPFEELSDSIPATEFIYVPKEFSLNTEWYSIKGSVLSSGVNLDSLSFMNKMKLTIGSKSQGLFKKPKPIVLLENENPYVKTIGLQNIVISNELKWYEKKSLWFGLGISTGILVPLLIK